MIDPKPLRGIFALLMTANELIEAHQREQPGVCPLLYGAANVIEAAYDSLNDWSAGLARDDQKPG